jgi:hypothetical protein
MRIYERPEAIILAMRPAYDVQDIPYDETTAGDYVRTHIEPLSQYLSSADYEQLSEADITHTILRLIDDNQQDSDFIHWSWDHKLWYQLYEEETRLQAQYDIMLAYLELLGTTEERQAVLADYILEMDFLGYTEWKKKGEALIAHELAL